MEAMSASIGVYVATALFLVIGGSASARTIISNEAYERLRLLEMKHCFIGQPQPVGDWPIREWRREMRLCRGPSLRLYKIRMRCNLGLSENSEACAQLRQYRRVDRYPPPDPRRRE
jgi:hypothetical protein